MTKQYRTSYLGWVISAVLLAAGLGFVPSLPSGKGDPPSLWSQVRGLVGGNRLESAATFFWDCLLIAIASAGVGWALQGTASVLRGLVARRGPSEAFGPAMIAGMPVLEYTQIDRRHRFVGGNERRWVDRTGDEVLYGTVAGLAICGEPTQEGVVLVGCDREWRPVWQTPCTTVEVAESQAEFEYESSSRTWVRRGRED
jgi:hypothetical protein